MGGSTVRGAYAVRKLREAVRDVTISRRRSSPSPRIDFGDPTVELHCHSTVNSFCIFETKGRTWSGTVTRKTNFAHGVTENPVHFEEDPDAQCQHVSEMLEMFEAYLLHTRPPTTRTRTPRRTRVERRLWVIVRGNECQLKLSLNRAARNSERSHAVFDDFLNGCLKKGLGSMRWTASDVKNCLLSASKANFPEAQKTLPSRVELGLSRSGRGNSINRVADAVTLQPPSRRVASPSPISHNGIPQQKLFEMSSRAEVCQLAICNVVVILLYELSSLSSPLIPLLLSLPSLSLTE